MMKSAIKELAAATESVTSSARDMLMGEAHYFEETVTPEKIKKLLDNTEVSASSKTSVAEKTEGMKYLLAMMAKGRDVSEFYPDVVRNVIVKAVEVKKLVYNYLVHHADANPTCRELALLAINSFQRDLLDSNQLIRGLALKVLCGIRVREIVQIQIMSVKKAATDSSPYVRKTAAHSVGKIYSIDADTKPELVEIIDRLLGDKTTAVLSSAVAAFNQICPENIPLLHPHYRKLCHLLADLDEWGQIQALQLLTRYARTQFTNPEPEDRMKVGSAKKKTTVKAKTAAKKKKGFYSDSDNSSEESSDDDSVASDDFAPRLQEDHSLLLRVALPLLRSRNSGVVLAVASLHHYAGPRDRAVLGRIGRALVRIMRGHREVQYVVLTNIVEFAKQSPDMFRRYLKDFFIAESEPVFVRRMKLEVLTALVAGDNAAIVLREFTRYVKDNDKDFVKAAIQSIVRIANNLPDVADRCLRGLMALVSTVNDTVVAEAVIAIRQLLQQNPQHDALIIRLARRLHATTSPSARAAMVWILGEFQAKPKVAAMAPDALRQLAKNFRSEAAEVKYQILNLAAKTALTQPESKPVQLLLQYVLELARYDADYDLRDRARLLRHLMLGSDVSALAADAIEEAGAVIAVGAGTAAGVAGFRESDAGEHDAVLAAESAGKEDSGDAEGAPVSDVPVAHSPATGAAATSAVTAAPAASIQDRVKAVILAAKPPPAIEHALANLGTPTFIMGSLSFMVGHQARGYCPLPAWATVESSPTVRDPPKDEYEEAKKKKKGKYAVASSSEESSSEESDSDDSSSGDDSDDDSSEKDSSAADSETSDDSDDESHEAPKRASVAAGAGKKVVAGEDDEEDESDDATESSEEESD